MPVTLHLPPPPSLVHLFPRLRQRGVQVAANLGMYSYHRRVSLQKYPSTKANPHPHPRTALCSLHHRISTTPTIIIIRTQRCYRPYREI